MILDAAFLHRHERELAHKLAREMRAQFVIASCAAPPAELERRLHNRRGDASEADWRVLAQLRRSEEPLAPAEMCFVQQYGTA